jgi:hypothetical protein
MTNIRLDGEWGEIKILSLRMSGGKLYDYGWEDLITVQFEVSKKQRR